MFQKKAVVTENDNKKTVAKKKKGGNIKVKLIAVLKATPKYNSASWLLRYQMESMLDIYKRLM